MRSPALAAPSAQHRRSPPAAPPPGRMRYITGIDQRAHFNKAVQVCAHPAGCGLRRLRSGAGGEWPISAGARAARALAWRVPRSPCARAPTVQEQSNPRSLSAQSPVGHPHPPAPGDGGRHGVAVPRHRRRGLRRARRGHGRAPVSRGGSVGCRVLACWGDHPCRLSAAVRWSRCLSAAVCPSPHTSGAPGSRLMLSCSRLSHNPRRPTRPPSPPPAGRSRPCCRATGGSSP